VPDATPAVPAGQRRQLLAS